MDPAALERERAHARAMKAKKMGERTWDADKEPVTKGRGTAFAREPGSIGRAPDSGSSAGRSRRDGDARGAPSSPQAASTPRGSAASRPATAERPKRPEQGIYMSPAARARMAVVEGQAAAKAAEAEAQALAREQAAAEVAKAKAAEEDAVLAEIQAAAERMEA